MLTAETPASGEISKFADDRVVVDHDGYTVRADGVLLDRVTPLQFKLFSFFSRHPDVIVNSPEVCAGLYGYHDLAAQRSMKVHLSAARRHLGPELGDIESGAIQTRRKVGYVAVSSLSKPRTAPKESLAQSFADDRLKVIPAHWLAMLDGKVLENLSASEFRLLYMFASQPGILMGPELLHDKALGRLLDPIGSAVNKKQVVLSMISSLRKKMGPELGDTRKGAIETVLRKGYRGRVSLPDA